MIGFYLAVVPANLPGYNVLTMTVAEGFELEIELELWTMVTSHLLPLSLFVFSSLQASRFSGHCDCHSQWSGEKAEEVLLSTFHGTHLLSASRIDMHMAASRKHKNTRTASVTLTKN